MPRDLMAREQMLYRAHRSNDDPEYWFKLSDRVAEFTDSDQSDLYWNIAIWCEQNAMDAERLATNA